MNARLYANRLRAQALSLREHLKAQTLSGDVLGHHIEALLTTANEIDPPQRRAEVVALPLRPGNDRVMTSDNLRLSSMRQFTWNDKDGPGGAA